MKQLIQLTLKWLFNPSPRITNPESIQLARLLSSILLILFTSVSLIIALVLRADPRDIAEPTVKVAIVLLGVIVIMYGLNRAGITSIAAIGLILPLTGIFVYIPFYSGESPIFLAFLFIPIILMAFFFSLRWVTLFAVVLLAALFVFISQIDHTSDFSPFWNLRNLWYFLTIATGLILTFIWHENKFENIRQKDLKMLNEQLQQNEEKYRRLFDNAFLGIFQSTPEGKAISVNSAFAHMFGYDSPEDAIKSIKNVGTDVFADPNRRSEIIRLITENPDLRTFENLYRRKDGSTFIGSLNTMPINDLDGHLVRIEGIIEDITDRKRAEQALIASEAELRALFASMQDVVFVIGREGIYREIAPTNLALLVKPPAELLGKSLQDVFPPERAEDYTRILQEVLETQRTMHVEYELNIGDQPVWFETSISPMNADSTLWVARDITGRKRAEEALQKSEAKFRSIFEKSATGYVLTSPDGRLMKVNAAMADMLGFTINELQLVNFRDITHPDDISVSAESLNSLLAGELDTYQFEKRYLHRNGTMVWAIVKTALLRDNQNFPLYFITSITDITERKHAEEALRESEEKMRSIFRVAPTGIGVVSNRVLLEVNPRICEMTGYSKEELIGQSARMLYPTQEEFELVGREKYQQIDQKGSGIVETHWQKKDGTIVDIILASTPIDLADLSRGVTFTALDITERKLAEDALYQANQMLALILDNIPQRIFWKDRAYNFLGCNKAFAQDAGLSDPGDIIGKNDFELPWKETAPLYRADDKFIMETGMVKLNYEESQSHIDGSQLWLRTSKIPLTDKNGEIFGILGTYEDITDRKRAEEEIRQLNAKLEDRVRERTAQLESANKELEAFSYSISHDLRAPLRAIDGFSRVLLQGYADMVDSERDHILNLIRNNTVRMGQLISAILTLSRVSRVEPTFSQIDMTVLAKSTYDEVAFPEAQQSFSCSIQSMPDVWGDPILIRQVWANLISNAIKFTVPKQVHVIEIGGYTKDGQNIYYVKDSGVGFNPDYAHKLFGVFQRLHRDDEFEGTGVGLATVQRIINMHGGRIWAESIPDQGATFYFTLPEKK